MDRQQAHQLLDELGPVQFDAVAKLLEAIVRDDEDEELSEADRRAVADSREYFRRNPEGGLSWERMVADCGFGSDRIRNREGQ